MKHAFTRKLGAWSLIVAFTVGVSAPGFAAERTPPVAPSSKLLASGQNQVRQLAATTPAGARAAQEGRGGFDEPGTFFKTKRGVALLVLAGAGIGYMWYSKVHDRIHSQARERLD